MDESNGQVEPLEMAGEIDSAGSVALAVWRWFSTDHIQAAALFCRMTRDVERRALGIAWSEIGDTLFPEHRAYVVSAVLEAATFLESSINEFFASAKHPELDTAKQLDPAAQALLSEMWEHLERSNILGKFQAALRLLRQPPFETGAQPYPDASLLVHLRNELVHYKARWQPGGSDVAVAYEAKSLTKTLRALKDKGFPPSPLMGAGNPFFPDKLLGHACAAWATRTSLSFADAFYERVGVTPPYDHLRPRLALE